MKQHVTFILLFTLFASTLAGQTTISGTVLDETQQPLPGANVYLQDTYDGATTDSEGRFSFTTTETGAQILKIEMMDYAPQAEALTLDGTEVERNIALRQSFSELKAVSITAGAFEASDRKKAVILTALDMVTTAGASGDTYGALQSLPGTSTVGESGRLFVRGGSSEETKTFIDGNLVHEPYTASAPNTAVRGRFNPFMFKGTVFSTGGYSAEYGQALSSVLQLETNELPASDQLDIGLLTVGADVAGTKTWDRSALTASANYTNLKPYMALVPQNLDWNQEPQAYGGQLNFRQETGKSGLLKLYGNFNQSRMSLNQPLPGQATASPFDLTNSNLFLNASWKNILNEKWAIRSGLAFTHNDDQVATEGIDLGERLHGLHAKTTLSHSVAEKISLRFGGEYFLQDYQETVVGDGFALQRDFADQIVAGYAEADIFASEKFVTRVGGRVEYADATGRISLSPRVSTALRTGKDSQVSLAWGQFYQNPGKDILRVTRNLRPERADHLMLNYQFTRQKRTFRAEAYYKNYQQLVKFVGSDLESPNSFANTGKGYAYGLDFFFRDKKTIKNGDYWISYSFIETERNYRDFPSPATPGFVSRHNLSVVYKHWISKLRSLPGATFTYGSPRRFNNPNSTEFNAETMPAYLSLDANWTYLYRENIIFHLAVSNIPGFNQEFGNRYAAQADADGNFAATAIRPAARRFIVVGCFITLSPNNDKNQLEKIN